MYEIVTAQEASEDYDNRSSVAWRLGLVSHQVNGQRVLMALDQYLGKRPQQVREKSAKLGNIQAGDGPRFKGRGVIQLAGRANYARSGNYRGRDYTTGGNQISLATDALVSIDVSACY